MSAAATGTNRTTAHLRVVSDASAGMPGIRISGVSKTYRARDGDVLSILGAWRPSTSQSTFAAETEIYDQKGDLVATGAGTFRYLKGERSDGTLTFLDQKAAD